MSDPNIFNKFPLYFFSELVKRPPRTESEATDFWVKNIGKFQEENYFDLSKEERAKQDPAQTLENIKTSNYNPFE